MTDVPCDGCTACCKAPIVLHPMSGDDPRNYECHYIEDAGYVLDSLMDGSCIYVGNTGCSIWEKRPAVCRSADCRVLAKMDWALLDPLRDDAVIRQGLNLLYDEATALHQLPDGRSHRASKYESWCPMCNEEEAVV